MLLIPYGGSKVTWDGGDTFAILGGSAAVKPFLGDEAEPVFFHRSEPSWIGYIVSNCDGGCHGEVRFARAPSRGTPQPHGAR